MYSLGIGIGCLWLLAGCAGQGVRRNDDGTLSIECAGGYHDWSACHQRAIAACRPDGFEIVSRLSNEGSSGVGSRDWSQQGSEVQRTMVVRCNAAPD
jgi:hypothetical protein